MDGHDLKDLRELVEFLKANEIAQFDLEREGLKLRLKFQGAGHEATGVDAATLARLMAGSQAAPAVVPAVVAHSHVAEPAAAPAAAAPAAAEKDEKRHVVKSPIVGTFYASPSPDAAAFVKVGDTVEMGQVLCIVEAMKLMNEIESDAAGELVEIIAKTGQPVEYGQALFAIRTK